MTWEDRSGRLDHSGLETLWEQVAADLRAEIESGELPAGSKLPSEPDLAELYGVARVTVRTAVSRLRDEGLLKRTTGRGTFVTR